MEYTRSFAILEALALFALAAWLFHITHSSPSDSAEARSGEEEPGASEDDCDKP